MDIEDFFGCSSPILMLIHERSCFTTHQDWEESIRLFLPLLDEYSYFFLQIRNKMHLSNQEYHSMISTMPFHPRILINIPSIFNSSLRRHRTEQELGSIGISASIHSLEKGRQYQAQYQFFQFGPIFSPISKEGQGCGLVALSTIVNQLQKPIVAVGGITQQNLFQVLDCSVFGVGVIGSILHEKDPIGTAKEFLGLIQRYNNVNNNPQKR